MAEPTVAFMLAASCAAESKFEQFVRKQISSPSQNVSFLLHQTSVEVLEISLGVRPQILISMRSSVDSVLVLVGAVCTAIPSQTQN